MSYRGLGAMATPPAGCETEEKVRRMLEAIGYEVPPGNLWAMALAAADFSQKHGIDPKSKDQAMADKFCSTLKAEVAKKSAGNVMQTAVIVGVAALAGWAIFFRKK